MLLPSKTGRGGSLADPVRPAGPSSLEREGVTEREIPLFDGPVSVGTDDSAGSREALALGRLLADAVRSQMLSVLRPVRSPCLQGVVSRPSSSASVSTWRRTSFSSRRWVSSSAPRVRSRASA
jgi:hypothetical protein